MEAIDGRQDDPAHGAGAGRGQAVDVRLSWTWGWDVLRLAHWLEAAEYAAAVAAAEQPEPAVVDQGRSVTSPDRLYATVEQEFGRRGLNIDLALCVWRNEGGVVGYAVSATNDHGPWQLHGARYPGDAGLLEVFYAQGYTDPYDVDQSTEFTARYVAANGWGAWAGARYCL